jgi:hypothetical protein
VNVAGYAFAVLEHAWLAPQDFFRHAALGIHQISIPFNDMDHATRFKKMISGILVLALEKLFYVGILT